MRRLPSNAKGLVTTATLNAPSSLASEATTGAAPEPVPPPRPEVMKIMSEPSRASMILSVSSSAALRPTSGLAPAPRPLVSFAPSCSLTGAWHNFSAWRSVLAAINSTPSTLARIMRLTALQPPPPTPMTLILAGESSSLKLMRIALSFAVILFPPCGLGEVVLFCEAARASQKILAPVTTSKSPGWSRHYTNQAHSQESVLQKLGAGEHGLDLGDQVAVALRLRAARLGAVQHKTDDRGIFRLGDLFGHVGQAARFGDANRHMKRLLHHFDKASEARPAARENKTGGNLFVEAGTAGFVADQGEKLLRAGLDDIGKHSGKDSARRAIANAGNFDGGIFGQK